MNYKIWKQKHWIHWQWKIHCHTFNELYRMAVEVYLLVFHDAWQRAKYVHATCTAHAFPQTAVAIAKHSVRTEMSVVLIQSWLGLLGHYNQKIVLNQKLLKICSGIWNFTVADTQNVFLQRQFESHSRYNVLWFDIWHLWFCVPRQGGSLSTMTDTDHGCRLCLLLIVCVSVLSSNIL